MNTTQNRGTDSTGRISIQLNHASGNSTTIRPPPPHTSTYQQAAYLEGFAAAIKIAHKINRDRQAAANINGPETMPYHECRNGL